MSIRAVVTSGEDGGVEGEVNFSGAADGGGDGGV